MVPTEAPDDPNLPPTVGGHVMFASVSMLLILTLTIVAVVNLNLGGDGIGVSNLKAPKGSYSGEVWPVYSTARVATSHYKIGVWPGSYPPSHGQAH